jgi:hypothetical protein
MTGYFLDGSNLFGVTMKAWVSFIVGAEISNLGYSGR